MTLESLLEQFKAGFRERLHAPLPRPEGDEAIRAGIIAVVTALRDEIVPPTKSRAASSTMLTRHVLAMFDDILGSDEREAKNKKA